MNNSGVEQKTTSYHTKLAGVTFEGRQEIIAKLSGKEPLRFRREPDNEYDKNAVAVDALMFRDKWLHVGYIAKDKNKDLAALLDKGESAFIKISDITGGDKDKSYGVNVFIEYKKAPEPAKPLMTPMQMLSAAIEEAMGAGVDITISANRRVKDTYHSRILGKSIEVNVHDGHIGLDGYMSGSKFPEKFFAEFDKERVLGAISKKYNVGEDDVDKMWGINSTASTSYGTAIHAALENYDTYRVLGDKIKSVKEYKTKPAVIGPNKALSRNPFLKKIVEDFQEKFGGDYTRFCEQFVWLSDEKLCGSIDRLKVIDAEKKIVRIQDYKTDSDIHEKKLQKTDSIFKQDIPSTLLGFHWLQLSFYAYILKKSGYTVEGLDIFWLNPEKLAKGENAWEIFSHDVIDIEKGL